MSAYPLASLIADLPGRKWRTLYDAGLKIGLSIRSAAIPVLRAYVESIPKKAVEERGRVTRALWADALRLTEPVARDLPSPPNGSDRVTHGWDYNVHTFRAYKATSSSFGHFDGDHVDGRNSWRRAGWSQNSVDLFTSEALATRALRHELANGFAEKLADLDARIATLEAEERRLVEAAGA